MRPISYVGVEGEREGKGLIFAAEIAKMIWGGVSDWNSEDNLSAAASRAGLLLSTLRDADSDHSYEAEILANQDALEKAGHWGVPTLVFKGEPFFGQDRVDMALWRMQSKGLSKR